MSESQFEKLLKTLKTAERERDLSRHTVDVQDKIINDLREDNEILRGESQRMRGLLRECRRYVGSEMVSVIEVSLLDRIAEELDDESE